MREIKFRAMNENDKWIYFTIYDMNPPLKKGKIKHLCQFTGILDANGKEIYEGDVVKQGNLITFVKWVNGGFWLVDNTNHGERIMGNSTFIGKIEFALENGYKTEVIGNIYEYPHDL